MRTLFVVTLLASVAGAQETVHPLIPDDYLSWVHLDTLKAGAWIETKFSARKPLRNAPADAPAFHVHLACVHADEKGFRFEETQWEETTPDKRRVQVLHVKRKTGKVNAAWIVRDGKPIPLTIVPAATDAVLDPEATVECTAGEVTVGEHVLECERIVATEVKRVPADDENTDAHAWELFLSPEVPILVRFQDPEVAVRFLIPRDAAKFPREPKGFVKYVRHHGKELEQTNVLVGFGADAKPTVEIK